MKRFTLFAVSLLFCCSLTAQTPDWSSKVASIIYSNCSSCHHEGGIGPFSLMSYQDAVDNAYSILPAINAGIMPPWPPDPDYSHFVNEKILSNEDIAALNEWVTGGMPSGDLNTAPTPPVFNGASLMQDIEETVNVPVYTIQKATDEYRTFVIHTNYTEDKYLNQIEFIPGDPTAVHHVLMYHDTSGISYEKDLDDPDPGYPSNGTTTASPFAVLIAGWAPGGGVAKLPINMGIKVPAGADFAIEIHYAPGSLGKTDSTKVNLKFTTDPNVRQVYNLPILYHFPPSLMDWPLIIPANQVKTFNEKSGTFSDTYSLLGIAPHMHLIGKSFKVFMVKSPGDTTNLINIPNWDFHWQLDYVFPKLIKFPAGAQIYGQAVYDNTTNNPNNPNNPPQLVTLGESTLDEMMVCFFSFLEYQPGDENIVLDSSLNTAVADLETNDFPVSIYPNPAKNILYLTMNIPQHDLHIRFSNLVGSVVKEISEMNISSGIQNRELQLSGLPAGMYLVEITSGDMRVEKKVMVE